MTLEKHHRQYEIVLLGATGYTGALTAEHIVEHLPTNLQWAIAGRSNKKLHDLRERLEWLNPDRVQPAIEIVSLDQQEQLNAVLIKSKICISVVSYCHVGAQVVEACVENGTDYLDASGGILQLEKWISQYHEQAKANGVALIHGCGAFSAPQDLLTWLAVRELKRQTACPTAEVILAVKRMTLDPSGGTVESIFNGLKVNAGTPAGSLDPWILSPIRGSAAPNPITSLGIRKEPHLGVLAASAYGARQDRAVVHRTWGLLLSGIEYGPNFHFNEYDAVSTTFHGLLRMWNAKLLGLFLLLGPIARLFFPKEGDGPDPKTTRHALTELEAVAIADGDEVRRVLARFKFVGGSYHLTAAVLAQGAASLLYTRQLQGGYEGGNLTPAMLGEDFVDRLKLAGAEFDVKLM